jgi:hypothetical protein
VRPDSGCAIASNFFIFGEFSPLAIGRSWHSVETLAPNPIGSSVAEESRPLVADQTSSTAPSGGGQKKKNVVLGTKRKQDKTAVDQVIIELPPYHGSQSPLYLVVVEHIFGRLFKAFDMYLRHQELILQLEMIPEGSEKATRGG